MYCPNCEKPVEKGNFCPYCGTPLKRTCAHCGMKAAFDMRFCPHCGHPFSIEIEKGEKDEKGGSLHPSIGAQIQIGDIGVFRGEIDASVHVGAYIERVEQVLLGPQEPDPGELLRLAEESVLMGHYHRGVKLLAQYLKVGSEEKRAHLLLAVALLGGRNANAMPSSVIEQVREHLMMAMQDPTLRPTALAIWAVVQYDHYLAHGLHGGEPNFFRVLEELRQVGHLINRQLLRHIQASPAARKRLGVVW